MITEVKAHVNQIPPDVLGDGIKNFPAMSKIGQLVTADWQQRLALAGRVFKLNLGTTSGEGTATGLTGNAAHDNDQPEIVIANDSGWLIPMVIDINIQVHDDGDYDEVAQIGVFADRTQTVAAGATGTIATAVNLLDGGEAFNGRCYTTITSDITNPIGADVLAFRYWENTQIGAEVLGTVPAEKSYYKEFDYPTFLKGPCSIVGYVTGTQTPVYFGAITFAHIPSSWVLTS